MYSGMMETPIGHLSPLRGNISPYYGTLDRFIPISESSGDRTISLSASQSILRAQHDVL